MNEKYRSQFKRTVAAADAHGIELRADLDDADSFEEKVDALIDVEWLAEDIKTGETVRAPNAWMAWARLRNISSRTVHEKLANFREEGEVGE